MVVGTFQYLIGLQYSYKNDLENMKLYFEQALENVAGTPYEENIKNILKEKYIKRLNLSLLLVNALCIICWR